MKAEFEEMFWMKKTRDHSVLGLLGKLLLDLDSAEARGSVQRAMLLASLQLAFTDLQPSLVNTTTVINMTNI